MKYPAALRIIAIACGLWVALAPLLLAAPAVAAVFEISTCAHAADDCSHCPDADARPANCALACLTALQFVLPVGAGESIGCKDQPVEQVCAPVAQRFMSPDPAPPRSRSLL